MVTADALHSADRTLKTSHVSITVQVLLTDRTMKTSHVSITVQVLLTDRTMKTSHVSITVHVGFSRGADSQLMLSIPLTSH